MHLSDNIYILFTNNTNPNNFYTAITESDVFYFRVRACHDVSIFLSRYPGNTDTYTYQFRLGYENNTKSAIVIKGEDAPDASHGFNTPHLLDCYYGLEFRLRRDGGELTLSRMEGDDEQVVMEWTDTNPFPVHAIHLASGDNATAEWAFNRDQGSYQFSSKCK